MFSENDFKVLNQIRLTQGGASQRELSKCLGLSLGTINKTVRTLEDQGLIQKRINLSRRIRGASPLQGRKRNYHGCGSFQPLRPNLL